MTSQLAANRVRARGLSGYAELVTQCGGDCDDLLQRVGIRPELLHTPDASLEHEKLVELLEQSARILKVSDFGLRLAELQGVSVLGPIALIAQHAATVAEAVAAVGRNMSYHSPGARIYLSVDPQGEINDSEGMACLRYELQLPDGLAHRQNSELAYAISLRMLKMVSVTQPDRWRIHFAHSDGLTAKQYTRHLGCQVLLGQPFDALYFPKAILDEAIEASDPALVETAQRFVSHIIARSPLDLVMQIEGLINRQLAGGGCTLPRVAKQLAMSSATLQRRLRALGASFDEIADRIRKDRATEFLLHTNLPLDQICGLLGYTELSSLNRSCRRWFGETPLEVRKHGQISG